MTETTSCSKDVQTRQLVPCVLFFVEMDFSVKKRENNVGNASILEDIVLNQVVNGKKKSPPRIQMQAYAARRKQIVRDIFNIFLQCKSCIHFTNMQFF